MTDEQVKKWLSKDEAWAYDASLRAIDKERRDTTNPDGSPRVTYVSGPWHATVAALRTLVEARKVIWSNRLYDSCWCAYCDAPVDYSAGEDAEGYMIVTDHRAGCPLRDMPHPK